MNDYPSKVKEKLNSIIDEMGQSHWLFSQNPGHDFMRQNLGKLSFSDTMKFIIGMGKGSTVDELVSFFDLDAERIPSQSAFVQRRSQISLNAFETLFSEFSTSFYSTTHTFKDHCILACDGTHVVYATNPEIIDDYNDPKIINYKGYNHMHLNAFVDVISKAVIDVVIQPGQHPDERAALHLMLDHFNPDHPDKYIITADRGYESYSLLFRCELKNLNYVFRVKDLSKGSILSGYTSELPDDQEEFDVTIKRFFTDRSTAIIKDQPDVYHIISSDKSTPYFKQFLNGKHARFLQFRVVKIKTAENSYEYILTNLPSTFDIDDIRECYHYRWGIEVAFRYLKHAAGLLYFHSKKPEFLKQEIYATLTMYNFGIFLANEAAEEKRKKKSNPDNKYVYDVDISSALKITRKFYLHDDSVKKVDVLKLIQHQVHAVKNKFRNFARPLRGISAVHFGYR